MQKILSFDRNGIHYHVFQFNGDSRPDNTIKDIGAHETIEHAVRQGANVIVDITSGNYGEALRKAALDYNEGRKLEDRVKLVHIIGPDSQKVELGLKDYRNGFNYSVPYVFSDMETRWITPEDRVEIAGRCVSKNDPDFKIKGILDVTHHMPIEYVTQSEEVLGQTFNGRHLDYLALPVGTGRTITAFDMALGNIRGRGIPVNTKFMGIVPEGENPIYHNFVVPRISGNGIEYVIENFNSTSKADKLSCPGTDLLPRLREIQEKGSTFLEISNESVVKANTGAFKLGKKYGANLKLEDSGSVGFALLDPKYAERVGIRKGDNVGIFVTGQGLYASPSWVMEKMKTERRSRLIGKVKRTAAGLAIIAGLNAGIVTLPYLAGKMGLINYEEHMNKLHIQQQKVQMIRQIFPYDASMLQAMNKIQSKYGNTFYGYDYTSHPDSVLDEIILEYLKLNKDKIQNARDPKDTIVFDNLRFLVIQSQELRQK